MAGKVFVKVFENNQLIFRDSKRFAQNVC